MASNSKSTPRIIFGLLFCILTLLCWSPIGYGSYGAVGRIFGIPSWSAILLIVGAVLFVVEWIYLFKTDLALNDDHLDNVVEQLKKVEIQ